MPNERWQADITHWQLADGTSVEILNIEDDHSRLDLASHARLTTTGGDVLASFRRSFRRHGIAARVLTNNAAVFTGKPRRGGRVALELELDLLGGAARATATGPPCALRRQASQLSAPASSTRGGFRKWSPGTWCTSPLISVAP